MHHQLKYSKAYATNYFLPKDSSNVKVNDVNETVVSESVECVITTERSLLCTSYLYSNTFAYCELCVAGSAYWLALGHAKGIQNVVDIRDLVEIDSTFVLVDSHS